MSRTSQLSKPRPLREDDLVQVVAPASPFDEEQLAAGCEVLRSWGLRVRFRDDITERRGYFAGTPERRAAELHEAFADPEVAAVLAVRGATG